MTRPTLSVAMIVKNEEENLARALASVARHVDEVIIVDTGSTDRTREVAVSYGASVFEFTPRTHPDSFFVDDEKTCAMFQAPGPYSGDVALADFGAARNESFRHASGDYVYWVDADDVVENGHLLRDIVADIHARGVDFGFLAYDYARDHLGRVFYRQWRERIMRRGAARWVNPVHEVLLPTRPTVPIKYEQVWHTHHRKADRPTIPHRNYKLLLRHLWLCHRDNPTAPVDPRTLYYLGQEARFVEPLKAVGFYEQYLRTSGWPEERGAAHVALGSMYEFGQIVNDPAEALARANREYATAAAEQPENPDGLLGLARIASLRERWQDCVTYSERAFALGNPDTMLGSNPMDRLYRAHVYYNYALAKLGRLDEAAESCRKALAVCPDDPGVPGGASGMLAFNLQNYEREIRAREESKMQPTETPIVSFGKDEDVDAPPAQVPADALVIWSMQLWKQIVARGELDRAQAFLDAFPPSMTIDPVFAKLRDSLARRRARKIVAATAQASIRLERRLTLPGKLDSIEVRAMVDTADEPTKPGKAQRAPSVVFWTGPAFEPWDPTTPNTRGIGGSETACIELARALRQTGCEVTVFGNCPTSEGAYDGVQYVHYEKFTGVKCDVFVASRAPGIMDFGARIDAKLKLLWVHDIHVGPRSPQLDRWLLRFDRILCLSAWHKQFFLSQYPTVHPGRVIVTRNGINLDRFVVSEGVAVDGTMLPRKKGNQLVFSSSPNRGLPVLLQMFPRIRAEVPDAELHLYYGFDCWEKLARMANNQPELDEINRYKQMIADAERRGGVVWHGRVSQAELAGAFLDAKVWLYPTAFHETSCITAMEAQAAGCVPVATRLAALAETVKSGTLIEPDAGPDPFVRETVRLLRDEHAREYLAAAGRRHAFTSLSWRALADDWRQMFDDVTTKIAVDPMPRYYSIGGAP